MQQSAFDLEKQDQKLAEPASDIVNYDNCYLPLNSLSSGGKECEKEVENKTKEKIEE